MPRALQLQAFRASAALIILLISRFAGADPIRAIPSSATPASIDSRRTHSEDLGARPPNRPAQAFESNGEWTTGPKESEPGGRYFHTAIYDSADDRVVVFGGIRNGALRNDVSMLAPAATGSWTEPGIAGVPPTPRDGHCAVYDALRQRMLVIGGYDGAYQCDVWALSLDATPSWSPLSIQGTSPPGRFGAVAIYDRPRDRVLVVGGYSNGALVNDVWELSLSGTPVWTQLSPNGVPPSGRDYPAIINDEANSRIVMIGGYDGSYPGDSWQLTLTSPETWALLAPAGPLPPGRSGSSAVFDPVADRVIMYGGRNSDGDLADVWELGLAGNPAWSPLSPGGSSPGARSFFAAVFEPAQSAMLAIAGIRGDVSLNDAWALSLNPAPIWAAEASPTMWPVPRDYFACAFDDVSQRMIVQGGEYLTPFNPCGHEVRMPTYTSDTWNPAPGSFPLWRQLMTSGPGPATSRSMYVWDSSRHRLVVFGGINLVSWACEEGYPNYYVYSSNNTVSFLTPDDPSPHWEQMATSGVSPPALYAGAAIYDPIRDRMLVFGGGDIANNSQSATNDVWALYFAGTPTWVHLAPGGTLPLPRRNHTAIYDPIRDRMITFGGRVFKGGTGTLTGQSWELSLSGATTWSLILAYGSIQPRELHAAVYDPIEDRMLVFGGAGDGVGSEVWALHFDPNFIQWRRLVPSGALPPFRLGHSMAFDDRLDRLIVFGGNNGNGALLNDVWTLTFSILTPAQVSLESAEVKDGRVLLAWYSPDRAMLSASVSRRTAKTDWVPIGSATGDGTGTLRFVDRSVMPGTRYGYRLSYGQGGAEEFTAESWVDVPELAFGILGVRPNPAIDAMNVSISLLPNDPANLLLIDMGGRLVERREVGSLGAGAHVVRIGPRARLVPGLYLVRLVQGQRSSVTRVAVMR